MKKLFLFLLLSALISSVFGESKKDSTRFKLQTIDLAAGKSFLSGGYTLRLGFKSANANTLVTLKDDKVFLNHVYPVPKIKSVLGPSVGYFKNVPFAGAIAKFIPTDFISTLHWAGYAFGEPEAELSFKPSFLFLINSVDVEIWKFKTYYCHVKFMQLPAKHIVGVSYQHQMTKNIALYTNVGYDFTNSEQLLQLGVAWNK
ncbi:MAG: hypothetical protein ACLFNO_03765 [Parcubacteria group bacterium]